MCPLLSIPRPVPDPASIIPHPCCPLWSPSLPFSTHNILIFLNINQIMPVYCFNPLQCPHQAKNKIHTPLLVYQHPPRQPPPASRLPLPRLWPSPLPQARRLLQASGAHPAHSCFSVSTWVPSPYFLTLAPSHPSNEAFPGTPARVLSRHSHSNAVTHFVSL